MEQLLCHVFGDYVLQNDYLALNKSKKTLPCLVHDMRQIITIVDVGNVPPSEVEDFMEEVKCRYNNIPYVKKSKTKRWIYNFFDVLGCAGSFGAWSW